jgi:predicted GIY-YIG superfamily endonuclease
MRLPVRLVYVEELPDVKSAMRREIAIKKMTRERKKKLFALQGKAAALPYHDVNP